jgi:hypothetical protein
MAQYIVLNTNSPWAELNAASNEREPAGLEPVTNGMPSDGCRYLGYGATRLPRKRPRGSALPDAPRVSKAAVAFAAGIV